MQCVHCAQESVERYGRDRRRRQRYRCRSCGKTFVPAEPKPLGTMRIDREKAVFALRLLLEGMSVRAVERLTNLHRDTICDLVLTVGSRCAAFLRRTIRDVPVREVECDEAWSFIAMKEKTRQRLDRAECFGDSYCYIATARESRLVLCFRVGKRTSDTTWQFVDDLREATSGRFQVSTDGYKPYQTAVPLVFQFDVDFAQLVKRFGGSTDMAPDTRYSPAQIIAVSRTRGCGNPDMARVCTSHSERLNLSVRMTLRRWTRLTNGHSKSLAHHEAMLGLFFAWYNFARKHATLGTTPAVAHGLTDHVWTIEELLERAAE